jgi:hypothetical protein
MRAIFFTQGRSLDVLYQLYLRIRDRAGIAGAGFYVAGVENYRRFVAKHPDFEQRFSVVKEWEIYRDAAGSTADLRKIARFEEEIGDPTLWSALVCDRRLYMGAKASFRQDYAPRSSHREMLAILDVALERIDQLFTEVAPDAVLTVYTATFGDCLGHMFARARGIRSLDMRLARLRNCVMLADGLEEPPPHIAAIHEEFGAGVPEQLRAAARAYLSEVRSDNAMYDGVVPAGCQRRAAPRAKSPGARLLAMVRGWYRQKTSLQRFDRQAPPLLSAAYHRALVNPLSLAATRVRLAGRIARPEELRAGGYALYPLHTEPELVLAHFARPCMNQIEVVRNIGLSLPVGIKLLVKEHPMMLGRRPTGYYRKLLEIPNVRLAGFNLSSREALTGARLVVVIRGAIGLEAVIRGKPVIGLGRSMFELLPDFMFRTCRDLYELPRTVAELLAGHRQDEEELIRYVAAVIRGAVAVNLVSDLLGKPGRYRTPAGGRDGPAGDHEHLDLLADYALARLKDRSGRGPGERRDLPS